MIVKKRNNITCAMRACEKEGKQASIPQSQLEAMSLEKVRILAILLDGIAGCVYLI